MDKAMGFWILGRHGPSDLDLDGDDGLTQISIRGPLFIITGLIQQIVFELDN